ncbi:Oidioi.mRNA.OKI2018_I69.chr2.g7438.t1.cds [Oikopleura dioica]|uniref:Oidioi.mRNA.OKI2018_I69.chr2.g7438.t1.cds n=1 Tax=Oikopleura dioica TaxID=34765 RepID=A0ABN7T9Q7_OIKDI|nr:Oidioi.mRNA.OKI2018_I69.chr2.g7438.t1.cds [Oikopleura dioica]
MGAKTKRTGSVGCARPEHQTKCGPITRHFEVDFDSGVNIDCNKNRCWISCPETKVNTLPRWTKEVICRNSVRNIWNIKKSINIACVNPSLRAREESLKCGALEDFYPWYKKSDITAICSGRREKYEQCDLYCPDGTRPKRKGEVFDSVICHRGKRKFEPALEEAPVCG